uniref:Uncharacterized protein n=1 Tax=Tetranychus urticae TaxID=32264 RepID=T1JZI1_TETUR
MTNQGIDQDSTELIQSTISPCKHPLDQICILMDIHELIH